MKIFKIEISFPRQINLSNEMAHKLVNIVNDICEQNVKETTTVMWPSGVGQKLTYMPMTAAEEKTRGCEFDENIFEISCYEREAYEGEK